MNKDASAGQLPIIDGEMVDAEPRDLPDKAVVDATIRKSMMGTMAFGVVPFPAAGMVGITAINLDLTRRLSKLYGVEFKEGAARKVIASVLGAASAMLAGRGVENIILDVIGPVGVPAALVSIPLSFGGCTYAVGRMFANHFERGGTFADANVSAMKEGFQAAYRESREWLGDVIKGKKKAEAAV